MLFAVCAVKIGITGIQSREAYATYLRDGCLAGLQPHCHGGLMHQIGNAAWISWYIPWLIGVFAGAPLLAREFETDAYRFSFAQGVSRRRQVGTAVVLRAAMVVVLGCLLGLLTTWSVNPWRHVGTAPTPFQSMVRRLLLGHSGHAARALAGRLLPGTPHWSRDPAGAARIGRRPGRRAGHQRSGGCGFQQQLDLRPGQSPAYRAMVGIAPLTAHPLPTTGPPGGLLLSWRHVGPGGHAVPARVLNQIAPQDWAHPSPQADARGAAR